MAKYYKFLVHLGDDTYHNIMLGDQLTVMSDVEKPYIPNYIDLADYVNIIESWDWSAFTSWQWEIENESDRTIHVTGTLWVEDSDGNSDILNINTDIDSFDSERFLVQTPYYISSAAFNCTITAINAKDYSYEYDG